MNQSQMSQDSSASHDNRARHEGEVVFFKADRGYGFIKPKDPEVNGGRDLFVHFHFIVQRGFKTLRKGDVVEFCLGENKQGRCAHDVKLLRAAPEPTDGGDAA